MNDATFSREIATQGVSNDYEFALHKLLATSPAITDVMALDENGELQLYVSRLRASFPDSGKDWAISDGFLHAKQGAPYYGPVFYAQGSEPYMTVAVPIEQFAGKVIGVLEAIVNLKHIWEAIQDLRVGKTGYAYIVNRSGDLVAHRDLTLVLQRRNIADLTQVKEAFEATPGLTKQNVLIARNLAGARVFSSYATIPNLDWGVFVEYPLTEAYAPLYRALWNTLLFLLFGLLMAVLASFVMAQQVVRPLQKLRKGAEHIGRGDLDTRVDVEASNEIGILAHEFNRMAAGLKDARAGLEQKVADRTRELTAAMTQIDEANRHKSEFLANVSHELRTPLNAIMGFSRIVLRKTHGQISDLQEENLRNVLVSAEHLLVLINDLLDLSKIEAGHMEVRAEPVELEHVINRAAATVAPMVKDGCRLVTDVAADVPALITDGRKLQQILFNLLSNAAKFTEQGQITVSASKEDGWVRLAVADTGVGIAEDKLRHVFEEFRQIDESGPHKNDGTGLGLTIAKRLSELLSGDISVESKAGSGSTFVIRLPVSVHHSTTEEYHEQEKAVVR